MSVTALESRPSKTRLNSYIYVKKHTFVCKSSRLRPSYKSMICPVFKALLTQAVENRAFPRNLELHQAVGLPSDDHFRCCKKAALIRWLLRSLSAAFWHLVSFQNTFNYQSMNILYWVIWVVQARNKSLSCKYGYSVMHSWVSNNENIFVFL